jgi:uncharacterized protein (DUF1800 family)
MLKPLPASKWNFATAAHLLNRAGFGGSPTEIERLAALGLEAAVDQLVDYSKTPDDTPKPEWAKPDADRAEKFRQLRNATDEERKEMQRQRQREQREHFLELQHWWLKRMATTRRPLQEKLTLFWHGHFATSMQKVRDAYLMWLQNETLRTHASGGWFEMLEAVTRDPAMLIWLDQAQSRPNHPNENYARELMELFTLGEGHYSEHDVLEGARALTGLTLDRVTQQAVHRPRLHDPGEKTILGKTGRFDGHDFLRQIVGQPQAAGFICAKLWSFFAAENPAPELVEALAGKFRQGGNQFGPLVRTLFLAEEFYAPEVVRQQIKSPVQLLVAAARQLERDLPPPRMASNALRQLGQDLFAPPNVKGWDGGAAWINTNTLLARHNLALTLVTGENALPAVAPKQAKPRSRPRIERALARQRAGAVDPTKLVPVEARVGAERVVATLERRLIQARFNDKDRATLLAYVETQGDLDEHDILGVLRLAMCTPEYQLT